MVLGKSFCGFEHPPIDLRSRSNDLSLPIDLMESFGWTEPDGIWSLGERATFKVYKPESSKKSFRLLIEGSPYISPALKLFHIMLKKSSDDSTLLSSTFSTGGRKTLSCIAEFSSNEEDFEIHTPDFGIPMSHSSANDFRELGFHISRFGVFEISPSIGTIPLGKSFSLSSPINLEDGFHEMEDEGVWGTNKSTFTIAFPEKAKEYKIDIDYHAFAPSENPRLGFRLMNGDVKIFKGVAEHGKDQSPFSFTYTPDRLVTKLTLEADQAKSPLELGISEDPRVLGLFLKSINIKKA